MDEVRPLHEVLEGIAHGADGGGDDPRAALAAGGHADLGDDLVTTALAGWVQTAPAEMAEHVHAFLADGLALADPDAGLALLASAPAGPFDGEVALDPTDDVTLDDDLWDDAFAADGLDAFDDATEPALHGLDVADRLDDADRPDEAHDPSDSHGAVLADDGDHVPEGVLGSGSAPGDAAHDPFAADLLAPDPDGQDPAVTEDGDADDADDLVHDAFGHDTFGHDEFAADPFGLDTADTTDDADAADDLPDA